MTAARKQLIGMIINGSQVDNFIELYKDIASITNCSNGVYRSYGDSACDDVILIPVTTKQHVQNVTISTNSVVFACDVQIFAGKKKSVSYLNNQPSKACS